MRALRRRRALAVVLAASAALVSCQTMRSQTWIGDEPKPATRDELYRLYGPPDAIRREAGSDWLRYDSSVAKGMTFGVRATPQLGGVGLVLSRTQGQGDRVWVEVAPDDRILTFLPLKGSSGLRYRLWPFGR